MVTSSLAADYLVQCHDADSFSSWHLYPLQETANAVDESFRKSKGAVAWASLIMADLSDAKELEGCSECMRATLDEASSTVTVDASPGLNSELVAAMSRILVQRLLVQQLGERVWKAVLPGEEMMEGIRVSSPQDRSGLATQLFDGMMDPDKDEIVEMVDKEGLELGRVPRKLVHKFNVLHRGIGLFTTKDAPIQMISGATQPDLYTHQRTSSKRIFPSLYDMFVGGVSLAGEDPEITARREMEEELGLSGGTWTSKIFQCVVCTAYNRCVVDIFSYAMDTISEKVTWQEEEVAWGDFVPYKVISAAADRSILRLVAKNEWPGQFPPIQSSFRGKAPAAEPYKTDKWQNWDFVPDGLLVWEAWLRFIENQ